MSRLLGLVGAPLPGRDVLSVFYSLCQEGNPDGWGISGYSARRAVYFGRQAESAGENREAFDRAVERTVKTQSPVLIAHFRKSPDETREIGKTQPFHCRDWVFAHDGELFNAPELPLQEARLQGGSDSERFGLWMLEHVASALNTTQALAATLQNHRSNLVFSSLNFLMSDGRTLWAYRDVGDGQLAKNESPDERGEIYSLFAAQVGPRVVVCSEPLPALSQTWTPLNTKTLVAFPSDGSAPQAIKI
ncbi:MAG: class II glutamine amidotransferase [Elusimicrobiota bacterium]|jgi:predicted glutamine amidotransferase